MTSELLSRYLQTHPVLIRKLLAGLRDRGYVSSVKGHGGGWIVACDLKTVTLRDIYDVVGAPTVFAMGNRQENPTCLVEQVVNDSLASAFREAKAILIGRLAGVTLADLSSQFNQKFDQHLQKGMSHGHQLSGK
jgi:DNA-binding IscR family transcriptional regulator